MLLCKALKLQVQFPHLKNGDKSSYLPEFLRGLSEITCGKKAFSRKSDADRVPNEQWLLLLLSDFSDLRKCKATD